MLERSEIISLLNNALGQTARLRKGGTEAVYFCPFCHHKKQKMECCLDERSKFVGVFNCWTCSTSGTLGKLLSLIHAPQSVIDNLYRLTKDIKFRPRENAEPENFICLPPEFHPLHIPEKSLEYKNALAYLKRRHVTREDILRYNIGFCESGEYEHHLIFPSYDQTGILNFFIGRRYYTDDLGFPYKKPEAMMDTIIGFECFINWDEPLNLVEGVFDACAVRNNAIPLFGKYPSSALRTKMNEYHVKRVNVVLDWDAWDDAIKMYQRLHREVPMVEVHLVALNGKDPSKLGFAKIHALIRNAREFDETDLLRYKLQL